MKTSVKCPHILALVNGQVKVAANLMIKMGQAGIEHSIKTPITEKKVMEMLNYL